MPRYQVTQVMMVEAQSEDTARYFTAPFPNVRIITTILRNLDAPPPRCANCQQLESEHNGEQCVLPGM